MKTKRIIALVTVFCMMLCFAVSAATLKEGSRGSEVVTLQNNLNKLIGANLEADGIFGAKTKEAVKNFQRAYGLDVDGIAGPATQGKINELLNNSGLYYGRILKKGCKGEDVKRLQSDLNTHNNSDLVVDGSFGSATKAAVEDFQSRHRLDVDGIAGSETQSQMKWCKDTGYTVKKQPTGGTSGSTGRILDNVKIVNPIKQLPSQCKAAAIAYAVNVIIGKNKNNKTTFYNGSYAVYDKQTSPVGSNGKTYSSTYKQDRYKGTFSNLESEIKRSIDAGLPIVVPVYVSNRNATNVNTSYTQHHWVVIVEQLSDGDYTIMDPGYGDMSTLKRRGYNFGLNDYPDGQKRYGYVSWK